MAYARISVEPSGETKKDDFLQLEQIFLGCMAVAAIANAQQANFFQLHLRNRDGDIIK